MKRDYIYIDDREGNAVAGAEVYIKTGAGALVTIYSDNGSTTQNNPMSTDNDGECNFFAADGTYTIEVYVEGVLQQTVLGHQHYDESGQLEAANNLSDVESAATSRENLGLEIGVDIPAYDATIMPPSWTANFTNDGEVRFYADAAMTVTEQATSGTGTASYEKSTNAAPSTFTATTSPVTLEQGAWLKIVASSVDTIFSIHVKRTA